MRSGEGKGAEGLEEAQAGDLLLNNKELPGGVWGLIPGSGRSYGEENGNPLQYSCLENPHGWRSVVSYSPWGHKESDMTE